METLWFVLMTTIAVNPGTIEGRSYRPGDVIESKLLGWDEDRSSCELAGADLARRLIEIGRGTTTVIPQCVQLPSHVQPIQFGPQTEQ